MLILLFFVIAAGILSIGMIVYLDKKTYTKAKKSAATQRKLFKALKRFRQLDQLFLTRGGIRKIYSRICELSVYGADEAKAVAVKFYTLSTLTMCALSIAGAFIFKDLFTWLLIVLFALVMKTTLVDKQIDKIHYQLLQQLLQALSSVRENYLRLGSIPDAIAEAETGPLLRRAFDEIYMMLTSVDSEKHLEEFFAGTPYRLLQTFACVCYQINDSGDPKLQDGTSNFLQAISFMESEVQLEVQKLHLQKAKFGSLEIMPIIPLATLKIIEVFFSSRIPGLTVMYNGLFGYVVKVIIVLSSILGYSVIVKLNSAVPIKKDDRNPLVMSLMDQKWFSNFISEILPKKSKRLRKKINVLKGALSTVDMQHLYGKKVLYMIAAFSACLVFLIFAVNLGREFIYTNVMEASLVTGNALTKEEIAKRREMDRVYLSYPTLPSEKETEAFVKAHLPKLPEYDRQAQIRRLQVKYESYYNTYFKWWMVLICYAVGYLGWFAPEIMLRARAWLLKTEAEEDVLQMQTLIAILMNTSVDTMDALFWMYKLSRVHSRVLLAAYHNYPSEPEMTLEILKEKVSSHEFKGIIDKLKLTVNQISLAEAFSDLVTKRRHMLNLREVAQTTAVAKKRFFASPLAMAPLYLTVIGYIIAPLGILGVREFVDSLQNFNINLH